MRSDSGSCARHRAANPSSSRSSREDGTGGGTTETVPQRNAPASAGALFCARARRKQCPVVAWLTASGLGPVPRPHGTPWFHGTLWFDDLGNDFVQQASATARLTLESRSSTVAKSTRVLLLTFATRSGPWSRAVGPWIGPRLRTRPPAPFRGPRLASRTANRESMGIPAPWIRAARLRMNDRERDHHDQRHE